MKTILRLAVLAVFLTALPASAQLDWSSVGSTGQVDPTSVPHGFTGSDIHHAPAATGPIVARYQVTNTFGSSASFIPPWRFFMASFVDNSAAAAVSFRVFEISRCENHETTLCEIRSIDAPGEQCAECKLIKPMDFSLNTYFIEVRMNRTAVVPSPIVHHMGLF
jgi:hypothetical protein